MAQTAVVYSTQEQCQVCLSDERVLAMYTCPSTEARLNMAEIERSVKSHQCLDRRKREKADLEREVAAWLAKFHAQVVCINWPFITAEAHIKLKRLSPSLAD